jgi:hypothetical protein
VTGRRPGDGAGGGALGELEIELGGGAGVAGVAPVGVPARGHAQAQANAQRLAGLEGIGFRDEADLGARAGGDVAFQGLRREGREAGEQEEEGEEARGHWRGA